MAPAASAQGRGMAVYLNDVRLEGGELRGQTLTGVDVRFDENGDVRIIAKGYKITAEVPQTPAPRPVARPAPTPAPAPVAGPPKRFFIATSPQARPGAAQWDIEVYVNQTFVKHFRSKDPDPMIEITRFMRPGMNAIHFIASKEQGERISTSPNDYFELVIGDGQLNQGQLMLNPLASYKRTAAETGRFKTEITIDLPAAAPTP